MVEFILISSAAILGVFIFIYEITKQKKTWHEIEKERMYKSWKKEWEEYLL